MSKARNFGGNNRSEGYTHMVDLGELVLNTEGVWDTTGLAVLDALFAAVEYKIDGSAYQKANGLSVFYPFTTDSEVQRRLRRHCGNAGIQGVHALRGRDGASWDVPDDMNQLVSDQPEESLAQGETRCATGRRPDEETTVTQLDPGDYPLTFSTAIDEDGYYTLYRRKRPGYRGGRAVRPVHGR